MKLDEETLLQCAWCDDSYLHHRTVDVHGRAGEDAPTATTRVTATAGDIFKDVPMPGQTANPSDRRNGITICLWCEHCSRFTELRVAQHKGNTYLSFERHEGASQP